MGSKATPEIGRSVKAVPASRPTLLTFGRNLATSLQQNLTLEPLSVGYSEIIDVGQKQVRLNPYYS